MSKSSARRRFIMTLVLGIVLSVVTMYMSLSSGLFNLTHSEVIQTLLKIDQHSDHYLVIYEFRLPRIVIGALVGCALGIAGAVLQGITKNHLADPGILGIQAAVGVAVVTYMFIISGNIEQIDGISIISMSLWGWVGGLLATLLLFLFARNRGTLDPKRLILVGIALNAGFGALTLFISLKMNPQDFEMATVWLSGSIYSASWQQVYSMIPWFIIIVPLLIWKAPILNVLQLGEVSMTGIGLNKNRSRLFLVLCTVGLISASVIVSGSISFVGLIAPHISRRLVGIHYQYTLPISGVVGMLLVVLGDWIGRTIFAPAELAVGIVISIIGVPYFIYLLIRSKKTN